MDQQLALLPPMKPLMPGLPQHANVKGPPPTFEERGDTIGAQLDEARLELKTRWIEREREFPELAVYRQGQSPGDPGPLAAGGDTQLRALLGQILPKLSDIARVRFEVGAGTIDPLALDPVVGMTIQRQGIGAGSFEEGIIEELHRQAQPDPSWFDRALRALGVALAVVSAVASGGSTLLAADLSQLAIAGYLAAGDLEHAEITHALGNTTLDPTQALSQEDPSLTWLAVELFATAATTAATAVHVFREASRIRRAFAAHAGDPKDLERLNELGESAGLGDDLGDRVLQSPKLTRGMGAAAADEYLTLSSSIGEHTGLTRYASSLSGAQQRAVDNLTSQLAAGNMNPGIGTKHLFNGVFEARARNGARVYFRHSPGNIEIVGKSTKANQSQVISILQDLYGQ